MLAWNNGVPQFIATTTIPLAGDVGGTLSATVIGANKVTLGMLATLAANSVIGNLTGSTATPTAVATSSLFTWNGTGLVVRDTSPTLTTPILGYASSTQLGSTGASYFATGGGSVGIGTTTPFGLFSVEQGTESASFWVGNTGSSTPSFVVKGVNGNGNVGIGVVAPTYKLDVTGDINISTGSNYKINGANLSPGSWVASGNDVYNSNSGNIGIGTTTPYSRLSVWGGGTGATAMFELTNSASTTLASVLNDGTVYMKGNVGIGTTGPGEKFVTAGNGLFYQTSVTNNVYKLTNAGTDFNGNAEPILALGDNAGTHAQLLIKNGDGGGSNSPGLGFANKNAGGTFILGATIYSPMTDATAGSEDQDLVFSTQTAGAAATEVMRIKSGNVGIGQTVPTSLLHVEGTGSTLAQFIRPSAGPQIVVGESVTSYAAFGFNAASDLVTIGTDADNDALVINDSGNVGIGTTTMTGRLNISTSGNTWVDIDTNSGTDDGSGLILSNNSVAKWYVYNAHVTEGGADSLIFGSTAARMTIQQAGNVGIGTTSPTRLLSINTTAAGNATFGLGDGGVEKVLLFSSNSGTNGGQLNIRTKADGGALNDVMAITSAGNVGIGTTTPYSRLSVWGAGTGATSLFELTNSASTTLASVLNDGTFYMKGNVGIGTTGPGYKLDVITGSNATQFRVGYDASNYVAISQNSGVNGAIINAVGDADVNRFLAFQLGGSEKMRIVQSTGNIGIGTTTPGAKLDVYAGSFAGGSDGILELKSTSAESSMLFLNDATTVKIGLYDYGTGADSFFVYNGGDRLVVKNDGNVGIGTTTPSSPLHVIGGIRSSQTSGAGRGMGLEFSDRNAGASQGIGWNIYYDGSAWKYRNSDYGAQITQDSSGNTVFSTLASGTAGGTVDFTGATKMTILNTGNVGIGTTTPARGLHLYGSNSVGSPELEISNTSMVTGAKNFNIAADTTGTDHWDIRTLSDDSNAAADTFITLQTGGNVGIGTTNPLNKLHVNAGTDINFRIRAGTDFSAANGVALQSFNDANNAYKDMTFAASNFVFSTGNVGIGTTGPSAKLSLGTSGRILTYDAGATSLWAGLGTDLSGSEREISIFFGSGGTGTNMGHVAFGSVTEDASHTFSEKMRINKDGNVGIGTTAPDSIKLDVEDDIEIGTGTTGCVRDADNTTLVGTCVSDVALKKNIVPLPAGTLDKLAQLRPVTFEWRNDEFSWLNGQVGANYGLIAQEVEAVFPDMVTTDDRGYRRISYDIGLSMRILEGVKELYAKIEPIAGVLSVVPGVESQCVVGDTKLRRRRKGNNGEYEFDEVAIADVVSGDEIQSLDERTNRVVYSRVNALIDMGEQEVYELVTRSGRKIRTTSNHPFLARMAPKSA